MRNIYLHNSSLLNFKFFCCFWCWKCTRKYQIIKSRATRITNSLSLIQTWWCTDKEIFFAKILTYFTKTKMPCLVFREQFINMIQAQCTSDIFLWIVDNWSKNSCLIMLCFKKTKIFILGTLEQSFLSAFFTVSRSILGQCQEKNCNRRW